MGAVSPGTPDKQAVPLSTLHLTSAKKKMAWHKGSWWPLFVKEWYGPRCSQHMLDPYSFVILVLGLILHLIWGTDNIGNWVFGFLAAILVELVWEIIGNSSFVLKRIKANSGTSGEYNGDSIQNILGDVLSCAVGYILGTVFLAIELWWLSIVWIVVSELVCILYMRDSLVLAILTTLVPVQRLRQWQCSKIPKADSKYFFSRLCWWSARPKSC